MLISATAVCLGASLGALLRWGLGLALNGVFTAVPLGTVVANLAGGYLAGLAFSLFALFPELGAQWKLLVVTGFLGGFTTFSAFSVEVASLLQAGRMFLAASVIGIHVGGSLIMTFFGIATCAMLRGFFAR